VDGLLICRYLWSAFFLLWLAWALRTKPTQTRESGRSRAPYLLLTIAGFYLLFSHRFPAAWLYRRTLPGEPWLAAAGVILTAAGLALAVWARLHIGSNWSGTVTVKVGHELVRSGPYRSVRHPIYSGILLAVIGTAIERRQICGLLAIALIYGSFLLKSRIEERYMAATFGTAYEEYRHATGSLIPRFWH